MWHERLITMAIAVVIFTFALVWAYHELKPLLPALIICGLCIIGVRLYRHWQDRW